MARLEKGAGFEGRRATSSAVPRLERHGPASERVPGLFFARRFRSCSLCRINEGALRGGYLATEPARLGVPGWSRLPDPVK